jgi:hypothetical protein
VPTPEDPPEALVSPPRLVRASLRALALGLIAFPIFTAPDLGVPPVLATCAWAAIPVSLLEFWAVARGRTSARLAIGMFLFASLVLAAAYFQAFYAAAVVSGRSLEVGLLAVRHEVQNLAPGDDLILLVYAVQCQALACTLAMLWRMPDRQRRLIVWTWVGVSVAVPAADWILLTLATARRPELLSVAIPASVVLLLGGSLVGTSGLLFLYGVVDHVTRRSEPAKS